MENELENWAVSSVAKPLQVNLSTITVPTAG